MDEAFYCRDGKVAKTLDDLSELLKEMEHDEFTHHVTEFNNDFANWIKHVLGDEDLAAEVSKCMTKDETLSKINEHLMRKRVTQKFEEFVAAPSAEPTTPPVLEMKQDVKVEPLKGAVPMAAPEPPVKEHAINIVKRPEKPMQVGPRVDKYKYFTLKEFILGIACGFVLGFVVSKLLFSLLLK